MKIFLCFNKLCLPENTHVTIFICKFLIFATLMIRSATESHYQIMSYLLVARYVRDQPLRSRIVIIIVLPRWCDQWCDKTDIVCGKIFRKNTDDNKPLRMD